MNIKKSTNYLSHVDTGLSKQTTVDIKIPISKSVISRKKDGFTLLPKDINVYVLREYFLYSKEHNMNDNQCFNSTTDAANYSKHPICI